MSFPPRRARLAAASRTASVGAGATRLFCKSANDGPKATAYESIYGRNGSAQLVDAEGNAAEIPNAALHALRLIVRRMAHGERIALVAHGDELTTQQAADILHVSRPHLVKLLDRGDVPSHKVGSHRRVQTADLLAYRAKREATRHAKLDELARISEKLSGGYR